MTLLIEHKFMNLALIEANRAYLANEVPVGAIIVNSNTQEIIAASHNMSITINDFTAHAEMVVLRAASSNLNSRYLTDCDLYVTLEPCPMCAHAISLARIRNLYYACPDKKSGGIENGPRVYDAKSCHHKPKVKSGILENESALLLKQFFKTLRLQKKELNK